VIEPGMSVGAARRALIATFRAAGLDTPDLDARRLLEHATGRSASALATDPDHPLAAGPAATLSAYAARRIAREPLARILGEQEFFGLPLALGPETLVPRPDTETLVEAVLVRVPQDSAATILDIGTGSGAVLLAVLVNRPKMRGIGTDLSAAALATAAANATRHRLTGRVTFLCADLAPAELVPVDVLVSNPPYIRSADLAGLDLDVRLHDPALALDGGADGLSFYRRIARLASTLVVPGGLVAVETGFDQAGTVADLFGQVDLAVEAEPVRDLSGHARVVVARRRQIVEN
jgi:release factor glutamine methyltransferase